MCVYMRSGGYGIEYGIEYESLLSLPARGYRSLLYPLLLLHKHLRPVEKAQENRRWLQYKHLRPVEKAQENLRFDQNTVSFVP